MASTLLLCLTCLLRTDGADRNEIALIDPSSGVPRSINYSRRCLQSQAWDFGAASEGRRERVSSEPGIFLRAERERGADIRRFCDAAIAAITYRHSAVWKI